MKTKPIRVLTAVPICDGHDSAINTINQELVRHGIEVVYLGYHRSARDMVRAAIQEDVRAIGISSYNGGHVEFFAEVIHLLRKQGAADIHVFGGGGGTITLADAAIMKRKGVDRIFFAGTSLEETAHFVKQRYGNRSRLVGAAASGDRKGRRCKSPLAAAPTRGSNFDLTLARLLSAAESSNKPSAFSLQSSAFQRNVVGITGPGGAGKTTLIDELVLRFLASNPRSRVAILSHDPSVSTGGALLGDRATMIHSQDDRVFMRSLASRGHSGGLAACTRRYLRELQQIGFDLILIETVGIGQEALPFHGGLTDRSILVMSPDYGSRLQLQKIAMLDVADAVVVNKSDLGRAKTAFAEIRQRLESNRKNQQLLTTVAKQHRDAGVDRLFQWMVTP